MHTMDISYNKCLITHEFKIKVINIIILINFNQWLVIVFF